jgi:hypothetical protein
MAVAVDAAQSGWSCLGSSRSRPQCVSADWQWSAWRVRQCVLQITTTHQRRPLSQRGANVEDRPTFAARPNLLHLHVVPPQRHQLRGPEAVAVGHTRMAVAFRCPERFCLAASISHSTSRAVRYSRPRLKAAAVARLHQLDREHDGDGASRLSQCEAMAKCHHGAPLDGGRHDGSGQGLPPFESLQAAPNPQSCPCRSRDRRRRTKEIEPQTDAA